MKKIIRTYSFKQFCLAVLPPVVPLEAKLLPTNANVVILITVFSVVFGIIWFNIRRGVGTWTWESAGFEKKLLTKKNILVYTLMTLVFCFALIKAHGSDHKNSLTAVAILFAAAYSFSQEVIFQSYLQKVGEEWFGRSFKNVLVNAVIFTAMHAFFLLPPLDYALLFAAGLGYSYMYHKIRNIWLVSGFHFLTNVTALWLGMFHPLL